VLQIWRDYAMDVRGHSLPCGRYIPEDMPDAAYAALTQVLLEKD
jgi:haloacetate dehalogenase